MVVFPFKKGSVLPVIIIFIVALTVVASISVFADKENKVGRGFTKACEKNPSLAFCKNVVQTSPTPLATMQPSPEPIVTPTPLPSTVPNPAGAFKFTVNNPASEITCSPGDASCFQAVLIATNQTPYVLYSPTAYTSSPLGMLTYIDFNGVETSGRSISDRQIGPGEEALNTIIRIKAPTTPGTYYTNFYMDGKRCNNNVTPSDCLYYGASSYKLIVKVQ